MTEQGGQQRQMKSRFISENPDSGNKFKVLARIPETDEEQPQILETSSAVPETSSVQTRVKPKQQKAQVGGAVCAQQTRQISSQALNVQQEVPKQQNLQLVDNLRKHVHSCGLFKKIDLVITSPLFRTMQTAVGVFGSEGYTDKMDAVPLMVANAGNSDRPAISSLDCPPIVAVELCREHLGVHPCDKRRSISEYQYLFPAVDFSLAII
ncbi:phosphoglycerate mutase-like protein 1 isoform X2 [Actinidia eriantha]|uniref:phosphoglycerate mutase-like protein 1 isoform X2 n=1 Tax=Actinidia eriantha TaxID=165200 RepID=UPI00258CEE28|nr:phosphoglycerate mutase-like protein 1 isoform X2 [Actinidia eriantha]XP_057502843.1 phosphoglycerate mutase-like protein 1 isoform X2 [Actinidia eriantha]